MRGRCLGMAARTISHIGLRVQPLDRGEVGERRLLALQLLEGGRGKRVVDGAQAVGPLGVAVARVVQKAGGMGEQQRGHIAVWLARRVGLGRHSSLTAPW